MGRRFKSLCIVLLLAGATASAQLIPGIGFPGGGYPGRRNPQRGPTQTPRPDSGKSVIVGMLRKIDDKSIVVESDDGDIDTISISGSTKYSNASGGSAKIGDFQPGDHVNVSASQDSKKIYHAPAMMMVREGTPEEHSDASLASNDTSRRINKSASEASASPGSSASGDHPTLRRAPSSGSASASSDNPDQPVLRRAPASGSGNSAANSDTNDRPVLRRAESAASTDRTPRSQPAPSSDSDSATVAPPRLRRTSQPSSESEPVISPANAGPGLPDEDAAPARRMAPKMQATDDPFIDQAREAAFEFSETLPNYVVRQYTTRYATANTRSGRSSWQTLDNVTADVIEEDGTEKYKNILVNGKPPVRDIEKSGSWSKGEFSSLMKDVLSPLTNAAFRNKQATTIVNRAAFRYEFSVEQPNSHWHVEVESQPYMPAYSGTIWIDKENYRVLRIEMQAQDMPRSYPLDQIEWAVDYDYVLIGEGKYLLPTHSESLSCARSSNGCTRNVIEFRNYRKFTADTNITFEP